MGLVRVRKLVGMIKVRSWIMYYFYKTPPKDRNVRIWVCVRLSGNAVWDDLSRHICLLQEKLSSLSSFHIHRSLPTASGRAVFTADMTCLWPEVTQSPDCIAAVSIRLRWRWRTGEQRDNSLPQPGRHSNPRRYQTLSNLSPWDSDVFPAPTWLIWHGADRETGREHRLLRRPVNKLRIGAGGGE